MGRHQGRGAEGCSVDPFVGPTLTWRGLRGGAPPPISPWRNARRGGESGSVPAVPLRDGHRPALEALRQLVPFAPARAEHLAAIVPSEVSAESVLGRLASGEPRLRAELTGDLNRVGGSGGQFGRFVDLGREFLKARTSRRYPDLASALADDGAQETIRTSLGIYHPERVWFVSRDDNGEFWACSLTPKLELLRERFNRSPDEKAWDAFLAAIRGTLELGARRGLWLDCNPNNFGLEAESLYYIDDDLLTSSSTTIGMQALLRLREYGNASVATRLAFLAGFAEIVLPYAQRPEIGAGLVADLGNRLFWPREAELQDFLIALQRRLQSTRKRR